MAIKKYLIFIVVSLMLLFPLSTKAEEEPGAGTTTMLEIMAELVRISMESATAEESYQKCVVSSVLTDDMKMVYCKDPNAQSNSLFDLVLDFDLEIKSQETSKRFYKGLWNSTQNATYVAFDLFDWGTSIVTVILNAIAGMIEVIGGLFSMLVMFLVNISTSNTIGDIVRLLFDSLHNFIFADFNNAVMILVVMFMIGLLRTLIERAENLRNMNVIVAIFRDTFIAFLFVVFIAIPGRTVLHYIDQEMNATVALVSTNLFETSEDFVGDQSSTILKGQVFYALQEQPFMLRHFGAMSEKSIASRLNISKDEAVLRYEKLLYDPSYANAKNEVKYKNNKVIAHDLPTTSVLFLTTIFMLLHKFLLGLGFGLLSLITLLSTVMKEVIIGVTFIAIFSFAFSRTFSAAKMIGNRISWLFILNIIPLGVIVLLQLIIQALTMFGDISFILVFVVDIILIISSLILWKNKEKIIETLSKLKDPVMGMVNGTYSLADGYNDTKSSIRNHSSSKFSNNNGYTNPSETEMNIKAELDIDKVNRKASAELSDAANYDVIENEDLSESVELDKQTSLEENTDKSEAILANNELDLTYESSAASDDYVANATSNYSIDDTSETILKDSKIHSTVKAEVEEKIEYKLNNESLDMNLESQIDHQRDDSNEPLFNMEMFEDSVDENDS